MFAKYLKLSRKKAVIIIMVFAVLSAAAVIICSGSGAGFGISEIINASDIKGREKYLNSFGWEIDTSSEVANKILIPKDFNSIMLSYDKIQKAQGFCMADYAGMECMQYSYIVTNYPNINETVYATLYVYGTRVIGADIHSSDINGFMHGIK